MKATTTTVYILKFLSDCPINKVRRYIDGFYLPAFAFSVTYLPAKAFRFESWTHAQLVAFQLGIDQETEVLPQGNYE